MDEFSWIHHYLKPLATHEGALGLVDDAAVLSHKEGNYLVISTDSMVEGVHFLSESPASAIAHKILARNLSDIAAMGATPVAYTLAIMLPFSPKENWAKDFTQTLAALQEEYNISLIGGDTTHILGPLSLNITIFGETKENTVLKRNLANEGNDIYVSGTIGDAYLGLKLLQKELYCTAEEEAEYLINRYYYPAPRCELGCKLSALGVRCAIDISDGLVADLKHICEASNLSASILLNKIPLSNAAQWMLNTQADLFAQLLSGGDDYELLFTAPPTMRDEIDNLAKKHPLTRIGSIGANKDKKVTILHENGQELSLSTLGYRHF